MASNIIGLFDAIRDLALKPAQAGLGINYIDLADYNRVAVELGNRIKRIGPQNALNAVIVVPGPPTEEPIDAAKHARRVEQPFDIVFIWKRLDDDKSMRDVAEQWADPLHDVLCTVGMRALGNLRLFDAKGNRTGNVDGFDVGMPNFASEANDELFNVGLACFVIPVEVYYRTARDYRTLPPTARL